MKIYTSQPINTNFNAKQIPLSEYKGPILKLTKSEKSKIAKLQEELALKDIELAKANDLYKKNVRIPNQRFYFECLIQKLEAQINEIRDLIKEIKINRIQIQRKKQKT